MEDGHAAGGHDKLLVISDTHFGDKTELLNDVYLVERLCAALAERGEITELVLLGDVLDLWVKRFVPALRQARYFVECLAALPNVKRITYVPGNHDHQVFMDAYREEVDARVRGGDLTLPEFTPVRDYTDTVLHGLAPRESDVPWSMHYPFIVRRVNGKDVVLCHGHHLDFYDSEFGWARTFWMRRRVMHRRNKPVTLKDIEMAILPFCGAMSVAPWAAELVDEGLRFYRVINFFAKLFRQSDMQQSPRRDSLIKDNYDEIAGLLPLFGEPVAAGFVFGHTHMPGVGKMPGSGVTVANTGSWVRPEDPAVPNMTWVELTYDVKLYTLGDAGPELMYSESI